MKGASKLIHSISDFEVSQDLKILCARGLDTNGIFLVVMIR
jgi:hypothetical protein